MNSRKIKKTFNLRSAKSPFAGYVNRRVPDQPAHPDNVEYMLI